MVPVGSGTLTYVKSITFDCADALVVARFWAAALGGELDTDATSGKAYVEAPGWGGPNLWFQRVPEPAVAKNRMHFDLRAPGGRCRSWLRKELLAYERRGVVDATEERRPAHFHVVVYKAP